VETGFIFSRGSFFKRADAVYYCLGNGINGDSESLSIKGGAKMDKRYQVFVSSTYEDLREERQKVTQMLLECDCFPAGMELFPASDDDQWTTITRYIDDCDYYLLITAGCYGSTDEDGISYTEREYDYAVSQEKPVVAFVHEDLGKLLGDKLEQKEEQRKKLEKFHEKVQKKMVKYWTNSDELVSKVAVSIPKLKKQHPAKGWVRAGISIDPEEMLELRKQKDKLESQLEKVRTEAPEGVEQLAQGADLFSICFQYLDGVAIREIKRTWNVIFSVLGPRILTPLKETGLEHAFYAYVKSEIKTEHNRDFRCQINLNAFQAVKVQFIALGLVEIAQSDLNDDTYWQLTPYGKRYLVDIMAIRKEVADCG
jgi:Domain of unknown function (DUF4062)